MTVSTFVQPDDTAQDGSTYKASIDGAIHVGARLFAPFAAHEQAAPDMTVRVDAGFIPRIDELPLAVAAQDTGAIAAPAAEPRKDIVYVDRATGAVGVATGTEGAEPADPALPAGKIAVARLTLAVDQTEILNADLDDLRDGAAGLGTAAAKDTGTASGQVPTIADLEAVFFSTGDAKPTLKAVADPGWVLMDDGTIGSAASGATTRANADTEALYTLLWTNVTDTWAPVTGGRGASAAADFAADKPIALTKQLGRLLGIAGAGSGLTARALGETLGEEEHTLTTGELPTRWYGNSTPLQQVPNSGSAFGGVANWIQGGDEPHNNMPATAFWNVMIKL